jgi:hypothetical protein
MCVALALVCMPDESIVGKDNCESQQEYSEQGMLEGSA